MSGASKTVAGFNEHYTFQDNRVNLCLFNLFVRHVLFDVPPGNLYELPLKSFDPDGMISLYDAVGNSIKQVKDQIKKLEKSKQWEFSYLGATLDALEIASSLNIQTKNDVYFRQKVIKNSFGRISDCMASFSDGFAAEAAGDEE